MKQLSLGLFLLIHAAWAGAQTGGMGTYRFLYLQPNARIASLGGSAIVTPDHDVNLVVQNPSLLNKDFQSQLGLNFVNYFADIKAGDLNYAFYADKKQTAFSAGLQFINYGNFTKTAPDGQEIGTFTAGEYNLHMTAARSYKQFQYGATLKVINSTLEVYNSFGLAVDAAGSWFSKDRLMMTTAVISNVGTQLKTYTNDNYENIPYNIQLGFSKKFEHNPLRIGLILNNLQDAGKLVYQIPDRQSLSLETGQPDPEKFTVIDYTLSHVIVNTELIFGKTLNIRFGYNGLRRREMSMVDVRGMNGFTWGFGIKINRFQLSYGSGTYITGRSTNHFSVVTRLEDFKRKKTPDN